ncbi:urease accessory protein UreE [Methylobacterium nonmethylotrophicum]|uniref:Urease accessory protein UreE n=1 Tax=Methylobacterium nonmethylotrophicum TaxID=1141884 RepID=A0A4Z0NT71_9HYPH|nr:urease accessory protein UreE [Methylobacterium nonmethylotrophicum]TGE00084.1 urease accessory protein UreE [Methylobacterium nonmethylotrophicum]
MQRATTIVRKAAVRPDAVVDEVALDHAARSRRSAALTAQGGLAFRLDLDRATTLEDGDAVRLEDGRLVRVLAAPQALLAVTAENPVRLTRLAWQLGSNHVQAEMTADALYVLDDPVVAELIRGQGCTATALQRPFRPEKEVEAHDHTTCGHDHHHHGHEHQAHDHHGHDHHDHGHDHHAHGHDHDHAHHDHGHSHGHSHGHEHHAPGHGHVHGPGCKHGH